MGEANCDIGIVRNCPAPDPLIKACPLSCQGQRAQHPTDFLLHGSGSSMRQIPQIGI